MSDSLLDVGDELVVRVSGFPVARARIVKMCDGHAEAELVGHEQVKFELPLDVKDYEAIDGVAHEQAVAGAFVSVVE